MLLQELPESDTLICVVSCPLCSNTSHFGSRPSAVSSCFAVKCSTLIDFRYLGFDRRRSLSVNDRLGKERKRLTGRQEIPCKIPMKHNRRPTAVGPTTACRERDLQVWLS